MKRAILLGLVAVAGGAAVHACSDAPSDRPSTTLDAMPSAAPGAVDATSRCAPSPAFDAAAAIPPATIPAREITFDGVTCRHPEVRRDCTGGWCRIPSGCYLMGSPPTEWGRGASSEDQVAMTLTHDFVIGQTEVTQGTWLERGYANPSGLYHYTSPTTGETVDSGKGDCTGDPQCPVGSVTWFEAVSFANALSESEGRPPCYTLTDCTGEMGSGLRCANASVNGPSLYACEGYRLPTQAEREYAARAGTTTAFYAGSVTAQGLRTTECCQDNVLDATSWYCANADGRSHPVAAKVPNAWGLFDMAGNLAEWINDEPSGSTVPGPHVDFGASLPSRQRSLTIGGDFHDWAVAHRHAANALSAPWGERRQGLGVGFRLVRSLPLRDR